MSQKEYLGRMTPGLFWDVDAAEMNLDSCPAQVVQRVLEHGELNDWRAIRGYYGLERIVEVCKGLRSLDPVALAFVCAISNTRKEDYRCWRMAQSNPTLWNS